MSKVGSVKVPCEPPSKDTPHRIMFIGEAPGKDEEEKGRPFIGTSGQLLTSYLGRRRLSRDEVFLTNLCKYRPSKNDFKNLLQTEELTSGLEELKQEILTFNPTVIVALGNWPLYYLTGKCGTKNNKPIAGTGIMSYRGSVLPNTLIPGGPKVLATFHPAFIVRAQGFGWHPVFDTDIGRAREHSHFPELGYPEYTSYINPDQGVLSELVDEMIQSPIVSIDIETFGSTLACVGFTSSEKWGLCLTYEANYAWEVSRYLLQHPVEKMFQFGAFDVNWLKNLYKWETAGYGGSKGWDTFIAAASLMPEFPRGLDFLTSIYTPFPYYKTERKDWKETGDLNTLWEYNIKDVIATLMIGKAQMQELKEIWR